MMHSHRKRDIYHRLKKAPKSSYIRDFVYGGIDGSITTFVIVAGVMGAHLPFNVIIILGLSNLVADGLSMAFGNYLSTKSEHDEKQYYRAIEEQHVKDNPKGERAEIRQILKNKGLHGRHLEEAIESITSDEEKWIEMMLQEEYGLPQNIRSPLKAAMATYLSFLICGAVPLIPFFLSFILKEKSFTFSTIGTFMVFFLIGSLKSKWSIYSWWKLGLQTLLLGSLTAISAYFIGNLFHYFG